MTSVESRVDLDIEAVREIVRKHRNELGGLLAILEEIQSECGFLPAWALKVVAAELRRPLIDVYSVATFYRAFSLQPRGRQTICVCLGTACHVRGGEEVARAFERALGIRAGQTTADGEFTLETVNCLGACALGPIAMVNGRIFSKVQPAKVPEIVEALRRSRHRPALATAST